MPCKLPSSSGPAKRPEAVRSDAWLALAFRTGNAVARRLPPKAASERRSLALALLDDRDDPHRDQGQIYLTSQLTETLNHE